MVVSNLFVLDVWDLLSKDVQYCSREDKLPAGGACYHHHSSSAESRRGFIRIFWGRLCLRILTVPVCAAK